MRLKDFRIHFESKLVGIYPKTEIDTFFFLLVEEYLKLERIEVALQPNFEMNDEVLSMLNTATERLCKEEPIQYILDKTEFYGLPFKVNKDVLIPRPETEELVDWILKTVASTSLSDPISILDIGTGSGCIPVSLKKHLPNAEVHAIDVSKEAIKIAKQNASLNNVTIHFIEKDILNINELEHQYDIIVSNPPYVRELEKEEIKNNVLKNEPHLALFVEDNNPLVFYNKIAELAKNSLQENGTLFFEINQYLGRETLKMLKEKGYQNIELRKDLFGNDRMIKVKP